MLSFVLSISLNVKTTNVKIVKDLKQNVYTLMYAITTMSSCFFLSVISHINCIVAGILDNRCLSHAMCLYQVMTTLHFLNDVANDAESKQKLRHNR